MKQLHNKNQEVFNLIARIPKGKVTTYGALASKINTSARAVGTILHSNPDPQRYPCHRVVRSDGSLATGYAFGGKQEQMRKLKEEGVVFKHGRVVL
ncbi:cysteine methyltransferase [Candidatus Roizmanbacteria bacterium CG10_big_fil_rev_8_21_14_0_10_39_6]|uniref:Cysteine methyltransferase n=1 Tax=Candidatus Roizmanbacteria bacterium CG10_big_fil_rev_8_21_14_0_10_39_6 TaxID=1974853 RepID=A0A2M8KS36_9BACT|nr:MAG: cysteine methyltransferase [Candidatus Roizmanbacteria bacterium CG10_big_fil_rev_8_21_14_0_10_39_6]